MATIWASLNRPFFISQLSGSENTLFSTYNWLSIRGSIQKDNGSGIPADVLDSIFTAFFTTLPNSSGIGLSLAKQITQLHQNSIQLHSVTGAGSAFQRWFPYSGTF
ncbi:MAG: ATP-binding protein [Janthinobacterium lividum]